MKSRVVLSVVALVALTACGPAQESTGLDVLVPSPTAAQSPEESESATAASEPTGLEDPTTWTFTDVRPADPDAVAALEAKMTHLAESSWTATEATVGLELAWTPEHARVSLPNVEVHGVPGEVAPPLAVIMTGITTKYVMCWRHDAECVRVENEPGKAVEMDGGFEGIMWPLLGVIVSQTDPVLSPGKDEEYVLATVETAHGPLDCVVVGSPGELQDLEGESAVDLERLTGQQEGHILQPTCVEEHGLVVIGPNQNIGVAPWVSWSDGVGDDIDEYPFKVVDLADAHG